MQSYLKSKALVLFLLIGAPLYSYLAPAFSATEAPIQSLNSFDGQVESINHADMAAQVSGRVTQVKVVAGQRVKAGQLLLTLESQSADQQATASEAQIASANAELSLAEKEFQRQQALFKEDYISQAALDRAQTKLEAARAQAKATLSMARAARAQFDLYNLKAPFAGVVSDVPVNVGDMAMPGRLLVSLYDPEHLRVSASIPQAVTSKEFNLPQVKIEVPSMVGEERWLSAKSMQVFPTVDNNSHTVLLRITLDKVPSAVKPGLFTRVWLPTQLSMPNKVLIPVKALVLRGELTAVYVTNHQGESVLRQVRVGRQWGSQIEILSGLSAADSVVQDASKLSLDKAQ